MKNLILLFLLFPFFSNTQIYPCSTEDGRGAFFKATAKSGLNLRESPHLDAVKLSSIPYGDTLFSCRNFEECCVSLTVEGIEGFWKKVYYSDYVGYVFSGFLEELPQKVEVLFPEDLAMGYWHSMRWEKKPKGLAIYPKSVSHGIVEELKVKDTLISHEGELITLKIPADKRTPQMVVTGLPLRPGQLIDFEKNISFLLPGEMVVEKNICLYAKGELIPASSGGYPFEGIKDYQLILRRFTTFGGDEFEEQVLVHRDIDMWTSGYYFQTPTVNWVGDLDGDNELDLIISLIEHHACWDEILLLSSRAMGKNLVGQVVRYTVCGC